MSFSPQLNLSDFGFVPEKKKESEFSGYGFTPEEEKLGDVESFGAGLLEGTIGLWDALKNQVGEGKASAGKMFFGEEYKNPELPQYETSVDKFAKEKYKDVTEFTKNLPESEGESGRRLRVAGQTFPISATGGIPGIVTGLIGSQAGQTVREVFGEEGKFKDFGIGEGSAMGIDILAGGLAGIARNVYKTGLRTPPSPTHNIFRQPENALQRKVVQNAFQGEEKVLNNIIKDFSDSKLRSFENDATRLSQRRFSEMTESNASALKTNADNMFRDAQLDVISPIRATPDQAGSALQQAANTIFEEEVIRGERAAYNAAKAEARGITGQAPRTIERAKALREELTRNQPTPEQRPLVNFLDNLINDLETTIEGTNIPASKLLDAKGKPLIAASETAARTEPTVKTANDLVDLVQKSNKAVNYESELRLQSHRLQPIVNILREELGSILSQNPSARIAYQNANNLHGRNAEIWGTKYIRNMRFAENPESIVSATEKASNMRNLKQAIQDPAIQSLAERSVISKITGAGTAPTNRNALNKLAPELSPISRNSAEQLIQAKDPLTTSGGRIALRNSILKDVASSVNTGNPPKRILDLMENPKGYQIVRDSLAGSPQSREVFHSLERLFLEDMLSSVTDQSGNINFSKAKNIFKSPERRQVIERMGGQNLSSKFRHLENVSNNFEKNLSLYSKPETQSLMKSIAKEGKTAALLGSVLRAFHVPWPVIAGLGLARYTGKGTALTFKSLHGKILSNPKAVHYLEQVSKSSSIADLAEHLPRLLNQLEKED